MTIDYRSVYAGRRVLVTGGLGFIGSNAAIRLVQEGARVAIVDNLDPSGGANRFNIAPVANDLEIVVGDACNMELMRRLVRGRSHKIGRAHV